MVKTYSEMGKEIGELVELKNQSYGSAFEKAQDFLKLLYPNGVQPEDYLNMLAIVRIFDKLTRIATNKDSFKEEPWKDIMGYSLLSQRIQVLNTEAKENKPEDKKSCGGCGKKKILCEQEQKVKKEYNSEW